MDSSPTQGDKMKKILLSTLVMVFVSCSSTTASKNSAETTNVEEVAKKESSSQCTRGKPSTGSRIGQKKCKKSSKR